MQIRRGVLMAWRHAFAEESAAEFGICWQSSTWSWDLQKRFTLFLMHGEMRRKRLFDDEFTGAELIPYLFFPAGIPLGRLSTGREVPFMSWQHGRHACRETESGRGKPT